MEMVRSPWGRSSATEYLVVNVTSDVVSWDMHPCSYAQHWVPKQRTIRLLSPDWPATDWAFNLGKGRKGCTEDDTDQSERREVMDDLGEGYAGHGSLMGPRIEVVVTTASDSNPGLATTAAGQPVSSFSDLYITLDIHHELDDSKRLQDRPRMTRSGTEDELHLSYTDRALAGAGDNDDDVDSPVLGRWTEVEAEHTRRRKSGEFVVVICGLWRAWVKVP